MTIHQKISQTIASWGLIVVVAPSITAGQWRAARRPARIRLTLGLLLAATALVVAALLWAELSGDRGARVLSLLVSTLGLAIAAVSLVRMLDSRLNIVENNPRLFAYAPDVSLPVRIGQTVTQQQSYDQRVEVA